MLLYQISPGVRWRGSVLALLLDEGRPVIFTQLKVWTDAEGAANGAHMVIIRKPDGTFECVFNDGEHICFSAISNAEASQKLPLSGNPKYFPVGRILLGQREVRIPVEPDLRVCPPSCMHYKPCASLQNSRS